MLLKYKPPRTATHLCFRARPTPAVSGLLLYPEWIEASISVCSMDDHEEIEHTHAPRPPLSLPLREPASSFARAGDQPSSSSPGAACNSPATRSSRSGAGSPVLLHPASFSDDRRRDQQPRASHQGSPLCILPPPFLSSPSRLPLCFFSESISVPFFLQATTSPWKAAFASITSVLLDPESSSIRRLAVGSAPFRPVSWTGPPLSPSLQHNELSVASVLC